MSVALVVPSKNVLNLKLTLAKLNAFAIVLSWSESGLLLYQTCTSWTCTVSVVSDLGRPITENGQIF